MSHTMPLFLRLVFICMTTCKGGWVKWKRKVESCFPLLSLFFSLSLSPSFLNKLRVFIIHHLADRWVLLENIRKCLKSHIYANGMLRLVGGMPEFLICLDQCGKWRRQVIALDNLWSNNWIVKEEGHAEKESNFLI